MSDERKTDVPNPHVIGAETDGRTGAVTGFDTPDPKDSHAVSYTTTPAADRVGSADQGEGAPPQAPPAQATTEKYDHLATRDVKAMELQPEDAEFAGAQVVDGLGGDVIAEIIPTAGIGINPAAVLGRQPLGTAHQNPGYTPPSEKVVPHVRDQPGDLLPGEPTELRDETGGAGDKRR